MYFSWLETKKTKSSTNSNIQLKQRSYTILYAQFAETPSRVSGSKTEVLYCSIRWCLDAWGNVCQKRMGWPHIPASLNERPRRWKRNTALSLQGMDRGSFSLACSGDKKTTLFSQKDCWDALLLVLVYPYASGTVLAQACFARMPCFCYELVKNKLYIDINSTWFTIISWYLIDSKMSKCIMINDQGKITWCFRRN